MTPSNPLHYPRWVRLTPESEPVLVQNHLNHSALAGVAYDENACLVVLVAPEPDTVPEDTQMTSGLEPLLTPEEEEAQIAAAAGVPEPVVIEEPHAPSPEEAEDLGRPAEVVEDAAPFVPVEEEDLAAMFAKPAAEAATTEATEDEKPKRVRKGKE